MEPGDHTGPPLQETYIINPLYHTRTKNGKIENLAKK